MLPYRVIALATIATSVSASNFTSSDNLNGWYPCSEYTFSDTGSSTGQIAQCAVYNAPLCYPGICETPEDVNPEVDIFVKQLPATVDPDTAPNLWLLPGGPGDSSALMEYDMITLHSMLEGAVNVYTMDHRGTGRSTRFDCVAAQSTTTASPNGDEFDPVEVPACAKDIHIKYGEDLASFSVTTAATDVATFISKYTNGKSTIVYGVSYGTLVIERLMHLAPPVVTGYILDSVIATSGSVDEFYYYSKWDSNFGEVGDAFLALCEDDKSCKTRFQTSGLNSTLQNLIDDFDKNPTSTCAALVNKSVGFDNTPSLGLRRALGLALMHPDLRTLIPPVVYRLVRCSPNDVDVLTQFLTLVVKNDEAKFQDSAFQSALLYSLIIYSEMWESPLPSIPELKARYTNSKMSSAKPDYVPGPLYCAFSKEKSKSCDEFKVDNYDADGIVYKRDQYWNKTVTIPSQASVLVMNGKLDPQTPYKYAKAFFNSLKGVKKELVAFDYAPHLAIALPCGVEVIASYVRNGGDLTRLDKSCVNNMPAFNLTSPDNYLGNYFGTKDAYDGVFNSTLASSYIIK
ncbi:hypothetical protein PHMEG_00020138 [Phytophthora megakarya]|uniref:Peptidase S33 tripeptidyl aminopeptidase-like C-terminal domain-containing protein n=1 Tax=Phytophthora megakarya TaxID=4795 RepID=A0A225VPP7_9STRA|nr:hypothetical protein PHMEG_00020138 [Phytophthora megakarya]